MPVFGHDKARKEALVGVIMNPDEALINRYFIYDGGTVGRPYEFDSEEKAKAYHQRVSSNLLFDDYEQFKAAIIHAVWAFI